MAKNKCFIFILVYCVLFGSKILAQSSSFVWIGETEEKTLKTLKSWESKDFKLAKSLEYDAEFKANVTTYQLISDGVIYFNVTVFKGKVANYMYLDEKVEYAKRNVYINTIKSSKQWKSLGNGYFQNLANPYKVQQDLFTYFGDTKSGKGRVIVLCSVLNSKITEAQLAPFKRPGKTFEILK